jgi:hypothetical protein
MSQLLSPVLTCFVQLPSAFQNSQPSVYPSVTVADKVSETLSMKNLELGRNITED